MKTLLNILTAASLAAMTLAAPVAHAADDEDAPYLVVNAAGGDDRTVLTFHLVGDASVGAFQVDIDDRGLAASATAELSGRAAGHSAVIDRKNNSGTWLLAVYAPSAAIAPGEEPVVSVTFTPALPEGTMLRLSGARFSDTAGSTRLAMLGDGVDRVVRVNAATAAATPTANGDINSDGRIDVSDVTSLVNIILESK